MSTTSNRIGVINQHLDAKAPKIYTMTSVSNHNTAKDCWVVVNGKVIDATNFLHEHPGGKKAIVMFAGRDATEEFNMLHNANVIEKYYPQGIIGKVAL